MQPTWRRPTQARSRARFGAILDAAVTEFAEAGYLGATTTSIARRAGVPIGSLYQFFDDKSAVLCAIAERHLDEATDQMVAAFEATARASTLDEVMEILVHAAVAANDGDPRLHHILYREAARPAALQARLEELRDELATRVAHQLVRFGTPQRDAGLRATVLVIAIEALVHDVAIDPPDGTTREDALDHIVSAAQAIARSGQ